jgi:uncharacterized membrane protein HdeD (DUF308 family)
VQVVWVINSVLLLAGFIYEISHSGDNIFTLARPLGTIMFLSGLLNLIVCYIKKNIIIGSHWLIADGLTALLLSFFPLFNQLLHPVTVPFFFSFWELFSGILKFMDSRELKDDKIKCWYLFAIIGYTEVISGTLAMIKPIDEAVGASNVIGIIFFVQSVGFILKSIMYKYLITKKSES